MADTIFKLNILECVMKYHHSGISLTSHHNMAESILVCVGEEDLSCRQVVFVFKLSEGTVGKKTLSI